MLVDALAKWRGVELIHHELAYPAPDDGQSVTVPGYLQAESFTCGYVAALTIIDALYPLPVVAQENRSRKLRELIHMHRPDGVSERHFIKALRLFRVKVYKPAVMDFEAIAKWIDNYIHVAM